jgi:hypothetical protein
MANIDLEPSSKIGDFNVPFKAKPHFDSRVNDSNNLIQKILTRRNIVITDVFTFFAPFSASQKIHIVKATGRFSVVTSLC